MTNNNTNATDFTGTYPFTRRQVLARMVAGAAMALPTIVPARVLGRDGAVAPSEKINLGVIGIGPRCTYVLTSMLGLHAGVGQHVAARRADSGARGLRLESVARCRSLAAVQLGLCRRQVARSVRL